MPTTGATPAPPPASLPAQVQLDWTALIDDPPPRDAAGTPREALPPAARRWLDRAVAPGAEGLRSAELRMRGEIRIGGWRPFRARQVIAPGAGFVWAAAAGRGPTGVRGFDRYTRGEGEMRWRLMGLVPVMSAEGPDVTRSAAGRLAGEMVLCPPGAFGPEVRWEPGADDDHAVAVVTLDGREHRMTIAVAPDGRPTALVLERWGDPVGEGFGMHTFAVTFEGELAADGCRVPASMGAGWITSDGRDLGESFRAVIDAVALR